MRGFVDDTRVIDEEEKGAKEENNQINGYLEICSIFITHHALDKQWHSC